MERRDVPQPEGPRVSHHPRNCATARAYAATPRCCRRRTRRGAARKCSRRSLAPAPRGGPRRRLSEPSVLRPARPRPGQDGGAGRRTGDSGGPLEAGTVAGAEVAGAPWQTRRPPPMQGTAAAKPNPAGQQHNHRAALLALLGGGRSTAAGPASTWRTHGLPPPRPGISSSGTQALNQRRAVSGAPARPAGHRPLNIRPGRRHGSPPVSRSQAARAATGPLMRTFPGKLRTAPGRFSGGGAGGGAGFRSAPPATSERDHSTR